MTPDDPRHGTYAGGQTHWRDKERPCDPCRDAIARYKKHLKYKKARGYNTYVPAARAIRHVDRLIAQGMTIADIETASGVGKSTIRYARKRGTLRGDIATALLTVRPQTSDQGLIDATGARRRLQALAALGWSRRALANQAANRDLPLNYGRIAFVLDRDAQLVRTETHQAVRALYDALAMTLPPPTRHVTNARKRAIKRGHQPPLSWDESTLDDPTAQPNGIRTETAPTRHRAPITNAEQVPCPRCGIPRQCRPTDRHKVCTDCAPLVRNAS